MKASLKIDFIAFTSMPMFKDFEIFGQRKSIQIGVSEIIEISDNYFEEENWKMTCLKLISDDIEQQCIFQIYKNYNHCYCFVDNVGKTYLLLFHNLEVIKINLMGRCLEECDNNSNKYRKRIILANLTDPYIKINNIGILLDKFTKGLDSSSYQLSFYDLAKKLIVTKMIEMPQHMENIESIYEKYSETFKQFIVEFNKLLIDEKEFNDKFNKLNTKYNNFVFPKYFLNVSPKKIEQEFNQEKYIDFFYNMMILKIYIMNIQKYKKIGYKAVSSLVKYLNEKTSKIKNDSDLSRYQKILLINQFGYVLDHMSLDNFLNSNIDYFIIKKKDDNSILDLVEKFFKEYINNLNEDSDIFFKLLELDSGVGYLNGKRFYCFDMTNLNEIKKHLEEIFIETLITYKENKRTCAFIISKTGAVAINLYNIPEHEKYFLEKKLEENEMAGGKNVAAKIVVFLLHELNGHKKFLYNREDSIDSPFYFIENGKIYFLDYLYSESIDQKAVKILACNNKPDDGTYYELSYGKIGDYYAIEIIDKMDGYGELLDEVNLWVNDLKSLNEYFKYKYIIDHYKITLSNKPKNIKEKIQFFKDEIDKRKLNFEFIFKKEIKTENTLLGKKRKSNTPQKEKDISYEKTLDNENNGGDDNNSLKEKEENIIFNFDSMTYRELTDLYYSGKLKGNLLIECFRRIIEYEIQTKAK